MAEFKLKQTAEEVQRAVDNGLSFGESYGDTLTIEAIDPDTFDPSTLVNGAFLKISDSAVTMDDLSNGYGVVSSAFTVEIPPEAVGESTMQMADGILICGEVVFSVEERAVGVEVDGMAFPESGLYVPYELLNSGSLSLTIPGFGKFKGIQKLDIKYIPNEAINVQSDWNQTDETAMDYIKNKPQTQTILYVNKIDGAWRLCETRDGAAMSSERWSKIVRSAAGALVLDVGCYSTPTYMHIDSEIGYATYVRTLLNTDSDGNYVFTEQKLTAYTAEYTPTT